MFDFRKVIGLFVVVAISTIVNAQQEAQSLMYVYDPLLYNGAHAAAKDEVSGILHLNKQWVNLEGSPLTCYLTGAVPILNTGLAGGVSLVHQSIGISEWTNVEADLAYRIRLYEEGYLSLAVGGEGMWHSWNDTKIANSSDALLSERNESNSDFSAQVSLWCELKNSYFSLSMKGLGGGGSDEGGVQCVTHGYLSVGHNISIKRDYKLQLEGIVMGAENSPFAFMFAPNIDCDGRWNLGLLYEIDHYLGGIFKLYFCEHFYAGGAYTYAINGLANVGSSSSFELMLGFRLLTKEKPMTW